MCRSLGYDYNFIPNVTLTVILDIYHYFCYCNTILEDIRNANFLTDFFPQTFSLSEWASFTHFRYIVPIQYIKHSKPHFKIRHTLCVLTFGELWYAERIMGGNYTFFPEVPLRFRLVKIKSKITPKSTYRKRTQRSNYFERVRHQINILRYVALGERKHEKVHCLEELEPCQGLDPALNFNIIITLLRKARVRGHEPTGPKCVHHPEISGGRAPLPVRQKTISRSRVQ